MDLTKPIAEAFDRSFLRSMGADIDDPLLLADYWPLRTVHARRGGPGPLPDATLLQLATNQFLRSVVKSTPKESAEAAPAPVPEQPKKQSPPKRETAKAS